MTEEREQYSIKHIEPPAQNGRVVEDFPAADGMEVTTQEDNARVHRAKGANWTMEMRTQNGTITQFFMVYNNQTISLATNPQFPFILASAAAAVFKQYAEAEARSDPSTKPIVRKEAPSLDEVVGRA